MKTLSKQTLPDSLQNFMLGFKLRFYRRIQIAIDNLNILMVGALEGMAMNMTSGTLEYDVYWCHIVTASNVRSIRGKIPFNEIRKTLRTGDTIWCVKPAISISDEPCVFYRAKERSAFKPDGAVVLDGQCLWGNWISDHKMQLSDNSTITVDGKRLRPRNYEEERVLKLNYLGYKASRR